MATKAKNPVSRQSNPPTPASRKPIRVQKYRMASTLGLPGSLRQSASTGTGLPDVIEHLGNQLCNSMSFANDLTPQEVRKQAHTALELLVKLAPRNELEAMLAVQAIATHNAAIDCMSRAMQPGQSATVYDLCLKHAEKLMRIFKEQAESISRMQRHSPLLTASHSEAQPKAKEIQPGAEGDGSSKKIEQSDTLCDLRALLDSKKAS